MQGGPSRETGAQRRRALVRPLALAVGVHALLAMAQFGGAWFTGSAGITASAVHVTIGAAAHVSSLGGIWLSTRPADARHPYGYERFESLSALVIGMLLLAAVGLIAAVAIPRLIHPEEVSRGGWGIALMAASAAANGGLFLVLRRADAHLSSRILRSEATHSLADAVAAIAVLAGIAASYGGLLRFDPLVALVMGGVVAWRAWSIVRDAAATLTDVTPLDVEQLRLLACGVAGVEDCHAVRSRGEPGQVRVDLHIHVDPGLTVQEAHAIAQAVDARLRGEVGGIAEVLVHIGAASR
ncbi:MAG: cation diffusion facilitator family transporter [Dehalococcoidia bacterium]